jgi:hypothetical protein
LSGKDCKFEEVNTFKPCILTYKLQKNPQTQTNTAQLDLKQPLGLAKDFQFMLFFRAKEHKKIKSK